MLSMKCINILAPVYLIASEMLISCSRYLSNYLCTVSLNILIKVPLLINEFILVSISFRLNSHISKSVNNIRHYSLH